MLIMAAMFFGIIYGICVFIGEVCKSSSDIATIIFNSFYAFLWFLLVLPCGQIALGTVIWFVIGAIVNMCIEHGNKAIDTEEGREQAIKQNKAQDDYDNKYRNYARERESKKGTIEFIKK